MGVDVGWKSASSQEVRVVRSWCRRAEAAALAGEMWMGWGEEGLGGPYTGP